MLDSIVDDLKPYYFFNYKTQRRNSDPQSVS